MSGPTAPATTRTTERTSQRPHVAAVLEDRWCAVAGAFLRRRGWIPRLLGYTGYGTPRSVRVLARVLLVPASRAGGPLSPVLHTDRRPLRSYLTLPAPGEPVRVVVGGAVVDVATDRAGYVDVEVVLPDDAPLPPGRHDVTLTALRTGAESVAAVVVVGDHETFGVVSDIDDTAMVTAVPRPFVAAWNTFVTRASARRPVPGMPELYRRLAADHPGAPFVYLSNGAWNTAGTLARFLDRHGFPPGPLLLTDWGPTQTGWFRSGPQHKGESLDRLMTDFPHVRWLLLGDAGQLDEDVYVRASARWPGRVVAIAIRQVERARRRPARDRPRPGAPLVHGADGVELGDRLAEVVR
ncbi:App1 family protein [Krasilnikoviella flava]|uniref:Phosphatidate phosphatase APP1 n=1 Tax=Krasilnikoviella flava TaxID=526729 RepID=A0A1T5KGT4_9MICO|nr:phosphatase domain-containing protein [Krasilnikoviella flava]SKC62841.1 Phosphatidate phosphatase APP1 [Krasilnikoviella flava]